MATDVSSNTAGIEHMESMERTNYPISLSVEDFGEKLGVTANVVSALDPASICGHMEQALQSLVEAIDQKTDTDVHDLGIVGAEEKELLLNTWNETHLEYPTHLCVHQLFEQHVERAPEATAVVFKDQSLTYSQLNQRANRLAHYLIRQGVQPDARVAICMDRSLNMIVGVLAILKAGGAYVPLDPAYASDRLRDILADSDPNIVIADETGQIALGDALLSSKAVIDPNIAPGMERYEH
jgi:non-ribosomal peptide synthetase component F